MCRNQRVAHRSCAWYHLFDLNVRGHLCTHLIALHERLPRRCADLQAHAGLRRHRLRRLAGAAGPRPSRGRSRRHREGHRSARPCWPAAGPMRASTPWARWSASDATDCLAEVLPGPERNCPRHGRAGVSRAGRFSSHQRRRPQAIPLRDPRRAGARCLPAALLLALPQRTSMPRRCTAPRRPCWVPTISAAWRPGGGATTSVRTVFEIAWRGRAGRGALRIRGQGTGISGQGSGFRVQGSGHLPPAACGFALRPLDHRRVAADGFLYNMVRAIVGTLVEVGRGTRSEAWPAEVFARPAAAPPVPPPRPQGLFMVKVDYDDISCLTSKTAPE